MDAVLINTQVLKHGCKLQTLTVLQFGNEARSSERKRRTVHLANGHNRVKKGLTEVSQLQSAGRSSIGERLVRGERSNAFIASIVAVSNGQLAKVVTSW